MSRADVIVVGAGSAGCVLAARLAQHHRLRITLVEPPPNPSLPPAREVDRQRPSRWLNLLGSRDDWDLRTEPGGMLANRRLAWPRGRGLGGSSRINAMIWFPPTDQDLRMLADASGDDWNVHQLVAAYESTRALVNPQPPLWLSEDATRFVHAAGEIPDAEPMVYQRVNRCGRRWNPASLLHWSDENDSRVEVVRALVDRVLWDQQRAIGVRIVEGDSPYDLFALKGIVLCAGTLATPTILMRSGIGLRDELARHGIDVRCEHPSVGSNLQDHLIMPVILETKSKSVFSLDSTPRDIVRWQTLGTGPIGSNIAECGGLFADGALQIHVTPTNYLTFPKQAVTAAMTIGVNVTQPLSRGFVGLGSKDVHDQPSIHANYLAAEPDLTGTIQGVHLARLIACQNPLADWIKSESLPGRKRESDEAITRSIARYAQTLYHPVGTCRLGDPSDGVVDSKFALRGCQGLWIADASVLPKLTVGNPSATVMSLAYLAADSVLNEVSRS